MKYCCLLIIAASILMLSIPTSSIAICSRLFFSHSEFYPSPSRPQQARILVHGIQGSELDGESLTRAILIAIRQELRSNPSGVLEVIEGRYSSNWWSFNGAMAEAIRGAAPRGKEDLLSYLRLKIELAHAAAARNNMNFYQQMLGSVMREILGSIETISFWEK